MTIVYLATNTVNGKRYVGGTVKSLDRRRREHVREATRGSGFCRKFHRAIRKYGPAAFQWTVLKECTSRDEVIREEIRLIADLKPEYNITIGGRGIVGVARTPEWLEKMSRSQKGRKLSPERIAQIRATARPELRYKPVVCLQDGKWFESVKAAATYYGMRKENVGAVARGLQMTSKGRSFVFSTVPLSAEECADHLRDVGEKKDSVQQRIADGMRKTAVICINNGRRFSKCIDAASWAGVSYTRIAKMCRDGGQTKKGLRFMYADAKEPPPPKRRTPEQILSARAAALAALQRCQQKTKKRVFCVETGATYESITAAAQSCGVHISALSAAIHRNGRSGGCSYRFVG